MQTLQKNKIKVWGGRGVTKSLEWEKLKLDTAKAETTTNLKTPFQYNLF